MGRISTGDVAGTFFAGINFFKHDENDGEIRFRTKVAGTNQDVLTIVDGNIGIGLTNPQTSLVVERDWVNNYGSINIKSSSDVLSGIGFRTDGGYAGGFIYRDGTTGNFFELNAQGSRDIRALLNGSEKIRISGTNSNYILGIGTDNPQGIVHTAKPGGTYGPMAVFSSQKGDVKLRIDDLSNSATIQRHYITHNQSRGGGGFAADNSSYGLASIGFDNGSLTLGTNTSGNTTTSARISITSGGKIGMNQSAPYADLDITSSTETSTGTLAAHGIRLAAIGAADEDVIPITAGFVSNQDRARAGIGFISKQASSINGYAGAIGFYTRSSADGNGLYRSDEQMRIDEGGNVLIATTNGSAENIVTGGGINLKGDGRIACTAQSVTALYANRAGTDGTVIQIRHQGTQEGTISVSGTTVSYNGGHLARWSQLPGGAERTEILRGSVLSNIDEMCEWGDEDNEQLNRMKVSDVEGDNNIAGVFQAWDDDDDTYTNDFYCAMTGDFVIRIAQGVTVERGDLLMSAGDGTAKPQDDDIIRSKTIAKVTSTHVTCTYDDGSYCVPCVLMAC